jgi:hypothetical protein
MTGVLFSLLRTASNAGAIDPNRDGINRADGQDELQPACAISFRDLAPKPLAPPDRPLS